MNRVTREGIQPVGTAKVQMVKPMAVQATATRLKPRQY